MVTLPLYFGANRFFTPDTKYASQLMFFFNSGLQPRNTPHRHATTTSEPLSNIVENRSSGSAWGFEGGA